MPYRVRCWCLFAFLLAAASCGDSEPTAVRAPVVLSLAVVGGANQSWIAGAELPQVLEVVVTRVDKNKPKPVKGVLVNFRVVTGGGSVFAGAAITNNDGIARDYWTLGPSPGVNTLEVRAVDPETGEKQVFGEFTAYGLARPAGLDAARALVDDAWADAVAERLGAPLSTQVRTSLAQVSAGLGNALDPAGVEAGLTTAEALLATVGPPHTVEGTFLELYVARARALYEAALQSILGAP